jgi:hypothetical protein
MTTRTVKMLGLAYGSSPAEITVTLDGVSVYTGTVTTVDAAPLTEPDPAAVDSTIEFCNFEIPLDFNGTMPMTCTVNSGTVIFAQILANYCAIANTDPVIGTGADGFRNIGGAVDARSNAYIDGILQRTNHEEYPGSWWYGVSAESILTYDLDVQAGTANVAPPPTETPE